MNVQDEILQVMSDNNTLPDIFAEDISKSKAQLVTKIETQLSEILGMDAKEAFEAIAAAQQIRGGAMNLNRVHKSTLVILAHVLANKNHNLK